jgi:hypothetical protein
MAKLKLVEEVANRLEDLLEVFYYVVLILGTFSSFLMGFVAGYTVNIVLGLLGGGFFAVFGFCVTWLWLNIFLGPIACLLTINKKLGPIP